MVDHMSGPRGESVRPRAVREPRVRRDGRGLMEARRLFVVAVFWSLVGCASEVGEYASSADLQRDAGGVAVTLTEEAEFAVLDGPDGELVAPSVWRPPAPPGGGPGRRGSGRWGPAHPE